MPVASTPADIQPLIDAIATQTAAIQAQTTAIQNQSGGSIKSVQRVRVRSVGNFPIIPVNVNKVVVKCKFFYYGQPSVSVVNFSGLTFVENLGELFDIGLSGNVLSVNGVKDESGVLLGTSSFSNRAVIRVGMMSGGSGYTTVYLDEIEVEVIEYV